MTNKTTMPEPVTHYRGMQYYTAEMLEAYADARVVQAIEAIAAAIGSDDGYLYDIVKELE